MLLYRNGDQLSGHALAGLPTPEMPGSLEARFQPVFTFSSAGAAHKPALSKRFSMPPHIIVAAMPWASCSAVSLRHSRLMAGR